MPLVAWGQFNESDGAATRGAAPEKYLFPINPGQPNHLAGTMGELRNTHFHGGIDIRTGNRIGIPVLATQSGYIARASVSAYGYGTALYVVHPDGNTSVYGHLERYAGKLAEFVHKEQYKRKTFDIDLEFGSRDFPVQRGDTIAFSGNTGSSAGPHLHFEIRQGTFALNPLKFGFDEIVDNIPPAPKRIALRTLDMGSRINDRFGRFEFSLVKKTPHDYVLPVPILAHGTIGVELLGDDRMNNSPGRCGINYIEMYVDSEKVFAQHIDKVNLEETRGILQVMDYKTLETRGKRFNKLFIDDGNRLDLYPGKQEGFVRIHEGERQVRIVLRDASGNESVAQFRLKHVPVSDQMTLATARYVPIEYDILENTLIVTSKACVESERLKVFTKGNATEIPYSYRGSNQLVYLIDLRNTLPDSVSTCSGSLTFHFKDVVPSQTQYTYYSDWADIRFPPNALYDTLFLNVNHRIDQGNEYFTLGNRTIPLHTLVQVTLKPSLSYKPDRQLSTYRLEGGARSYLGGDWSNGKVNVNSLQLGVFTFMSDSVPPSITRIRLDRNGARFRIRDNMSGISYFEANIEGQWLLMKYDFKSGILMSEKPDARPLKGEFELKVVDRAGNERIFKQKIL